MPETPAEIEARYVALVDAMKRLDQMRDVIAETRKRSYDAHIAAGFTEEQALALCAKLTFD